MPRNTRVGDQWVVCSRCGVLTPLHEITVQKGLNLCTSRGCVDNLEKEFRQEEIIKVLSTDTREFEDRRVDLALLPDEYDGYTR